MRNELATAKLLTLLCYLSESDEIPEGCRYLRLRF
jgi:hypothetical protein